MNLPKTPIQLSLELAFPAVPSDVSVIDMFKAFLPMDRLLESIEQGELYHDNLGPIMRDYDGWCDVAPAIQGWCDCWERIARYMSKHLDLGPLRRMANRLTAGILLEISDLEKARTVVEKCRQLYFACPIPVRKRAVMEEQISIELESLGLKEAA